VIKLIHHGVKTMQVRSFKREEIKIVVRHLFPTIGINTREISRQIKAIHLGNKLKNGFGRGKKRQLFFGLSSTFSN
jgi:hypothetical protein